MSSTPSAPIRISPEAVAERRHDDDLFVLDVRREDDRDEWPLDGAYGLPIYDELLDEDFSGLESNLDELPQDREIAVVCVAGITSTRAATVLREHGYEARVMTDGMNGWGRVHRAVDVAGTEGITQVIRPGTGCVSYLVSDRDEALVIDPSRYTDEYRSLAGERGAGIVGVIDTHAHADHLSGGRPLADDLDVPYYLPEADSGDLERYTPLLDGETVTVGGRTLEVLATPGHTPGSVSLRTDTTVLSGDTVFVRGVGRPDLSDGDDDAVRDAARQLFDSLATITDLPDDTLVLPGHFSDEDRRPIATTVFAIASGDGLPDIDDREDFVEAVTGDLPERPANYRRIKEVNQGREPRSDGMEELELGPNNCAAG